MLAFSINNFYLFTHIFTWVSLNSKLNITHLTTNRQCNDRTSSSPLSRQFWRNHSSQRNKNRSMFGFFDIEDLLESDLGQVVATDRIKKQNHHPWHTFFPSGSCVTFNAQFMHPGAICKIFRANFTRRRYFQIGSETASPKNIPVM